MNIYLNVSPVIQLNAVPPIVKKNWCKIKQGDQLRSMIKNYINVLIELNDEISCIVVRRFVYD